jgi:hypothetical protein
MTITENANNNICVFIISPYIRNYLDCMFQVPKHYPHQQSKQQPRPQLEQQKVKFIFLVSEKISYSNTLTNAI